MKTYNNIKDFTSSVGMVVTIGTFDGLHLGHQKIINRMKDIAKEKNAETVVVTFDPHPRIILYPDSKNLKLINTIERKFRLLDNFGIDHLIVIPFTKSFSRNSPTDFIQKYLNHYLNMKTLVIGYDHHFGKHREGNFESLVEISREYNFSVEKIPALYINETAVSSSKIRIALMEGNVRIANEMLGYKYSITGLVVVGNKIGRTLGFPTANIEIEDKYKLIAAGGVYICEVLYKGKFYKGMGNIGVRPTIGINGLVTEVHIFDFDMDIYGEEISIIFIDRLWDETKFDNLNELKKQLEKDRENVKNYFSSQY